MTSKPSATGSNGRSPRGTFSKGSPARSTAQKLRIAILNSLTESDVKQVVKAMVKAAKDGDVRAAKLVMDFVGKPELADEQAAGIEIDESNFQEVKNAWLAKCD